MSLSTSEPFSVNTTTEASLVINATTSSVHNFTSVATFPPLNINANTTTPYYPIWVYPSYSPFITLPPTSVINNNVGVYYSYSFYSYLIVVVLLCMALLFARLAVRRRQELARQAALQRTRARQRTEINNISAEVDTNNVQLDSENGPPPPKDFDQPPAYDEVVQSYIDAKHQLRMAEEGAVGGGLTTAVSTVTIVTEVGNSATDLRVTPTTDMSETNRGPAPPTYESVDPNSSNNNNIHVA